MRGEIQGLFIFDKKRSNHEHTRNNTNKAYELGGLFFRVVSCRLVVPAFVAENELTLG